MKNKTLIKKVVSLSLILSLLFALFSFTALASSDIKVLLDGQPINFDVPPQIIDGRTMVPIRAIFESIGAEVNWNDTTKTATATTGNTTVVMEVGSNQVVINGTPKSMDTSPEIIRGRTLAPARYVAEAFGYTVEWDNSTRTVKIFLEKSISDPNLAFWKVMQGYWQTWKYDDSSIYFLNNINYYIDVRKPSVTVSYDPTYNSVSFRMEYDTEDNKSVSIGLNMEPENDTAKIYLLLYPSTLSAEGKLKINSFNGKSVLDMKFSNSNRINSLCNQIFADSIALTLKVVEDFLSESNTPLRIKDLGFENFDTSNIDIDSLINKISACYDMVDNENTSGFSSSTHSSYDISDYYVYKGTSVPCYDDISGDKYLGVDDDYRVFRYSQNGLKKYLSFLDDLGYRHEEPYHGSSGLDFYAYYDSEYIIYIAKTKIYINNNLIDVVKLSYSQRK